jgi:carbonic anhydrase
VSASIERSQLNLEHILAANSSQRGPGQLPTAPARRLTILTCMDSRLDAFATLGLELGDAQILRNAGGRVTDDMVRSLTLSTNLLGVREVGVIHHTRCAIDGMTDESLSRTITAAGGPDTTAMHFFPFADLEQGLQEDIDALISCPSLAEGTVFWGAIYDVDTSRLRVTVEPIAQR